MNPSPENKTLLKEQWEEGEQLLRLWQKLQKTKEFTPSQIKKLETAAVRGWVQFEVRHEELKDVSEVSETKYMQEDYYSTVRQIYNNILEKCERDSKASTVLLANRLEWTVLIPMRQAKLEAINSLLSVIDALGIDNTSAPEAEYWVNRLELLQKDFLNLQSQIPSDHENFSIFEEEKTVISLAVENCIKKVMNSKFEDPVEGTSSLKPAGLEGVEGASSEKPAGLEVVEGASSEKPAGFQQILDLVSNLSKLIEKTTQVAPQLQVSQPARQKIEVKLPQLDIDKFDGSIRNWLKFKPAFESIIHLREDYSNTLKMHYLQQKYLCGEAARVIGHLHVSESNYETAWKLLCNRYDNEKVLINDLISRFLNLPVVHNERPSELTELIDEAREIVHYLKNLGENTWNALNVHLVCQKLPSETLSLWEQACGNSTQIPEFSKLEEFIENRIRSLTYVECKKMSSSPQKSQHAAGSTFKGSLSQTPFDAVSMPSVFKSPSCEYCEGEHGLYACQAFKILPAGERVQFVEKSRLCVMCLNRHQPNSCKFRGNCRQCRGKHNVLLHVSKPNATTVSASTEEIDEFGLLATASLNLFSSCGVPFRFKVVIDQGSMVSYVSEHLMAVLKWPRNNVSKTVSGLEGKDSKARGTTQFSIQSVFDNSVQIPVLALILPKLTKPLPDMGGGPLPEFKDLTLADPQYYLGGAVDIILGTKILQQIILPEVIKGSLLAQKTHLGWIVSGACDHHHSSFTTSLISSSQEDEPGTASDDSILKKFWETEEQIVERSSLSAEETASEEFYKATTQIGKDGRYVCRLPFKPGCGLGRSRYIAVRYMQQLEVRFARDPQFKERYVAAMNEYFALGHAVEAGHDDVSYYLPHLAVIKDGSTSTKTRIVFNASSPTHNKVSLNDTLMIGPCIQKDIIDKICSFRLHPFVFVCDIVKMYRQINIHPDDWKFQKFVWRSDSSQPLRDYYLTTVTFGNASAPFTAVRTLQQLSEDKAAAFPLGSTIIANNAYVDDLHFGADTIEATIEGRRQLQEILASASFEVRKFASNADEIVDDLPEDHLDSQEEHKFLGLVWNSNDDNLLIGPFSFIQGKKLTKRVVLTNIAKIFDPMGWVQPMIVPAKVLLQDIWKANLQWDEEVPAVIKNRWTEIEHSLSDLSSAKVPRWLAPVNSHQVELHGFADASQLAYGAVIYAKFGTSNAHMSIVLAKSRVAPVKVTSIPRLELKAALLLSDIMAKANSLFIGEGFSTSIFGWSDSKVTLAWIHAAPEKWKPFVRNRVATIQEVIPPPQWNYVATADNPADVISRGCDRHTFSSLSYWFAGPHWLANVDMNSFTGSTPPLVPEEVNKLKVEERDIVITSLTSVTFAPDWMTNLAEQYSNFEKSCRILAWILRVGSLARGQKVFHHHVTISEVTCAERIFLCHYQKMFYQSEIDLVSSGTPLPKGNPLTNLNPFIDEDGLLRVDGRIHRAAIPFERKHPVILPPSGEFLSLIIMQAHRAALHGGVQVTLNSIRRKFWIVRGTQKVKAVLHSCVTCFRAHPRNHPQIMGILPEPRVQFSKPFLHTGVDFAGPIRLRISVGRGTRTTKGYLAVFVCLAVKAFHLEVVSSLTSDAFLAALTRFKSRRGEVAHLYSDNATNFVGAFRKLSKVDDMLAHSKVEWSFIPPRSPHFGGLWEAGVKSLKRHLIRSFGDEVFTYEEMSTVLCQIEACLNVRPLCPQTNDVDSLLALTPMSFLTGDQFVPFPEVDFRLTRNNLLNRWELLKKIYQDVCFRYKNEYLSRLQQRPKWCTPSENLATGQLVLVREDNTPTYVWPVGRIRSVHPGVDGRVRVATVKMASGNKVRPVTRLYPLPVDSRPEDVDIGPPTPVSGLRRSSRLKAKAMWALAIIFFLFLGVGGAQSQSIFKTNDEPGIHFLEMGYRYKVQDTIKLDIAMNVSDIRHGLISISENLFSFNKACNDSNFGCEEAVTDLTRRCATVNRMFNSLMPTRRQKRIGPLAVLALTIGTGLTAAGVTIFVRNTMSQFQSEVELLSKKQMMLMDLFNSQLDVLNQSSVATRDLVNEAAQTHITLDSLHLETEKALNEIKLYLKLLGALHSTDRVVSKFERLLQFLVKVKSGRPCEVPSDIFYLLNVSDFKELLVNASRMIPTNTEIPKVSTDSELVHLPALVFWADALLVSFQIPVVRKEAVMVMKPILVPVLHQAQMMWIDCPTPLCYLKGRELMPLKTPCSIIGGASVCWDSGDQFLDCLSNIFIQHALSESCRMRSTTAADTFIPLSPNATIYRMCSPKQVRFGNSSIWLEGSGIIEHGPSEMRSTISMSLTTASGTLKIPRFNLSASLNFTPYSWSHAADKDATLLEQKIESLAISSKSMDQWVIEYPYWTAGGVVLTIIPFGVVAAYLIKRRRRARTERPHKTFFSDL